MYEGQTLICKEIIEDNWLEYLAFIKKQSKERDELNKKRQELISAVEPIYTENAISKCLVDSPYTSIGWYEVSISSFWNWYIETKV